MNKHVFNMPQTARRISATFSLHIKPCPDTRRYTKLNVSFKLFERQTAKDTIQNITTVFLSRWCQIFIH